MAEGEIPRSPQSNPEESAPGERSVGAAAALPHPVPIVGVGASAGGLNAFKQLLQHLSIDTGMAFVLIQHLAPEHKSLLTELLAQTTQMPVCEVTDGIEVAPNRVYIIPPNTTMKLVGRGLQLSPRKRTRSGYLPIDLFFESIAAECGRRGIGVVLSGADGDGAVGLSAIAAAGGTTFAQDLPSSQFSEMPEHAAQTGRVDFILPPQEIAAKLNEIGQHFQLEPAVAMTIGPRLPAQQHAIAARQPLNITSADVDPLSHLFELLRKHTGVNFAKYKHATLQRRIQRRMSRHGIAKLEDYLTYIQDDAAEIAALYQDFLIDVTSFFRDPEVFQSLKERVFPQLAQQHSQLSPIRIWVPGCATGEEVYSIAICLLEVLDPIVPQPPIQIFATDLNSNAIETARAGIYKRSAMAHVSPERLRRFFVPTGSDYQISKSVRELCVFARHNLCSDPPFSRLDLISCRNVLIYFGTTLQKKTIQNLHYGLNPSGFLLLGTAETTNTVTELFTPIAKQHKIYAKRLALALPDLDFPQLGNLTHSSHQDRQTIAPPTTELHLKQIADEIVLQQYAPAGLIVNANLDILEFRGNTSPYLQPAPGKSSLKLMKMVEVGLRTELRTAIHQAKKLSQSIERVVEVNLHNSTESADGSNAVRLAVIPLRVPSSEDSYLLILFETITPQLAPQQQPLAPSQRKVKQTLVELENLRLKQELAALQEQLQMVIDEQEAANQDVRAASEEMLSSNEELQSTNEELETAKEEVQATNEELTTVNEELRSRNQEANQFNNDLLNILSSVQLPILIVGTDLRIGRFTPMAERLFNLIASDVGRSFSNIRHNLNIPDLDLEILRTIDTLTVYQQEIQDRSGRWYHLTIRPYKTQENQIVGATIVLVDNEAQTHRGLEVIDRSATAQNQLLEDLVDLSRITNHKLHLTIEPIDLEPVITNAIETVALAAAAKNIQIEQQLDPLPHQVLGDSHRIEQILWNLLTNAIKFTAPGGQIIVRLSLASTTASAPTASAQIQVIDNGKGISPEFLPYIFDRFRQADNFSTHMENGLGLGLAIVHHLVKLHASKITATSQLGQGSTFTVQLPLVVNSPAAMIVPIGFANAPPAPVLMLAGGATIEPEAPSLQGLNILVVDDETDVLTVLATILEHYGATVTTIDSAPAALQTLQAHPQAYELLLSDLGMPEMDGWELIRRIRALDAPAGGQIPAAALTAYNSSRDRELSRAAGFQAHIAKPIEPAQLVADVANLARKPK
jgi:two-component system, chemotaxis family, CheB/CheR fusion protein